MIITVGKPIEGARYISEGVRYNYTTGGHWLSFSFSQPSKEEIEAVNRGKLELRVLGNELALMVLFQISLNNEPVIRWSDAPFEWHRNVPESRRIPEEDEQGLWTITLVDTDTQLVQAVRLVSPDEAFMRALNMGIRAQALRAREPAPGEAARHIDYWQCIPSATLAQFAKEGISPTSPRSVTFAQAMTSFRTGKSHRPG